MYIHDISRLSFKAACQSQGRPDDRLCYGTFTMMRHELNAEHFAENIFKYIFLNEKMFSDQIFHWSLTQGIQLKGVKMYKSNVKCRNTLSCLDQYTAPHSKYIAGESSQGEMCE